jgi:hypothetical protein
VPGPNLPLAYNIFRLYSHSKAKKGCETFAYLIEHKLLNIKKDPEYEACFPSKMDSPLTAEIIEKLVRHNDNDENMKEFLERAVKFMKRKELKE